MIWNSVKTPPSESGRYLVAMEEFGFWGRHFSSAIYNDRWSSWTICDLEMQKMTIAFWAEVNLPSSENNYASWIP